MRRDFCTAFDQNYLVRGLSLYRSISAVCPNFRLWVLCYDDATFNILTDLRDPNLNSIRMSDLENSHPELAETKSYRSQVEYYFTCSPFIPTYILELDTSVNGITYLDADMWFYSSPEPIFNEMGDASIAIIEHRYPADRFAELTKHGIYNVSYLTFKRDEPASQCLTWWRERCVEWCFDRVEDGKFADQKYLDDWPERFEGVHVIKHPGAGLAPWNWMNFEILWPDHTGKRLEKDPWQRLFPWDWKLLKFDFTYRSLLIDGAPLIFYHFHGLRIFNRWLYDAVSEGRFYGQMPKWLRNYLYQPYIAELLETKKWLKANLPDVHVEERTIRVTAYSWRKIVRKLLEGQFSFTWPQ